MRNLSNITMRDLLPLNLKDDPDAVAASKAIAPEYWRIFQLAPNAVVFANVDNLSSEWLDLLAMDLNVDYYDRTLPLTTKRDLVKQSIPMHRKKGTPWAVEKAVSIVFGSGTVREWFEYGGEPYYFRVFTSNQLTTEADVQRFRDLLKTVRNVRSVLEDVVVGMTWGDVRNQYQTWRNVLGISPDQNRWGDISRTLWGM